MRVTWTLVSVFVVECLVFGLAMVPGALFWETFSLRSYPFVLMRIVVVSMAFIPAYGLFAFSLMVLSALSTRWLGWRTPANAEMSIKALDWPYGLEPAEATCAIGSEQTVGAIHCAPKLPQRLPLAARHHSRQS